MLQNKLQKQSDLANLLLSLFSLSPSLPLPVDHSIDFVAMDVAVNAVAGALKAFFADLPDPLIPYSLHPELVEAASKNEHTPES